MSNATFSLESEVGAPPCASPGGQTTARSGRAVARANRSRLLAKDAGQLTLGISGQHGSGSSQSVSLQQSLENRLRARMELNGSILFRLTWKEWVTPSGRRICALRASARRTRANGFGSWPTTRSTDGDKGVRT